MQRTFAVLGALSAALGVVAGAFAAHGLRGRVTPDLLAVAWALDRWPGGAAAVAGWLFVAGTALFSGSLYLLALGNPSWLGAVTPVGGLCFIAGWAVLAWVAARG